MHHGNSFDSLNEVSLPEPKFEVRNSLTMLSVLTVAAKCDLSIMSKADIIRCLQDTIEDYHLAYDAMD